MFYRNGPVVRRTYKNLMKFLLPIVLFLVGYDSLAQTQSCPINSNFSIGDLTHWSAYIGVLGNQNDPAGAHVDFDTASGAPSGTLGVKSIAEYNLPSVTGIQIITNSGTDYWGGFPTIPTIK